MKRSIVLSSAAADDLTEILELAITRVSADAAARLDRLLDRTIRSLSSYADRGRVVPELRERGINLYRELQASPYRIIFRVVEHEVWILAVVDGRRDLDELLYARARRGPVR